MRNPWKRDEAQDGEPERAPARPEYGAGTESELPPEPDAEEEVERPAQPLSAVSGVGGASIDEGGFAWTGVPRLRGDWDLVVASEAPGLTGADELGFVAAEDGDIYMDSRLPEGDITPLAEAIEGQLEPPYRAYGVRREGDLWAVAARATRIGRFQAVGDEIELTVSGDERTLSVDGRRSFGSVPELERLGSGAGDDFFVRATRIEDGLWEVSVDPL